MTVEAVVFGLNGRGRFLDRVRGQDFARVRAGRRRFVVIAAPEHVEYVLQTHRTNFVKSAEYEAIKGVAGLNLLTDEGDSWAAHRAALNPAFARRRLTALVDLMVAPIDEVSRLLDEDGGHAELNIHESMVRLTLGVVANALFSQRFEGIVENMHALATEGLRFTEAMGRLNLVGLTGSWTNPLLRRLAYSSIPLPPPLRSVRRVLRALDVAVDTVLDDRIASPTGTEDLLDRLIRADGGSWPRQRIHDETLTFMLAGHETTANALTWLWYLLASHPEARDRMLAEVDHVLAGRSPTDGDLAALTWTTACVQESQRIFSAVPLIARRALTDDVLGDHRIPADTTVVIPTHWIHHDPRFWPEPDRFDPGRFMPDASRPRSWTHLPFGGGRRICIGQSFALMEMVLVVATLSRDWLFDLVPHQHVRPYHSLTLRPRDGLQVQPRRRDRGTGSR